MIMQYDFWQLSNCRVHGLVNKLLFIKIGHVLPLLFPQISFFTTISTEFNPIKSDLMTLFNKTSKS